MADVEKSAAHKSDGSSSEGKFAAPQYDKGNSGDVGEVKTHHDGFFSAFTPHSFKRNPNARIVTEATDLEGCPLPEQRHAEPALAMKLKPRHLQMIAIGGSIGMHGHFPVCAGLTYLRNWSFRWIGLCTGYWWSSLTYHCLWLDRCYAVLYRPCSG